MGSRNRQSQSSKNPSLQKQSTLHSKHSQGGPNEDLIKEAIVDNDLQAVYLQEYLDRVTNFALLKIILCASELPSVFNNFKDYGGLAKKVKTDF